MKTELHPHQAARGGPSRKGRSHDAIHVGPPAGRSAMATTRVRAHDGPLLLAVPGIKTRASCLWLSSRAAAIGGLTWRDARDSWDVSAAA
jgi:hypothetical protein